ncbi:DUF2231 domain-containing protein [Nocardioides sp. TF02-7]|uniref:DUF2231 domain-containing protein n=1 Tax=Nocardioides sp. TF02-7 TaxID=2917724 RepID=UPI001F05AA48|nr:DUF2231 domain-containing protein [Nocardioides sp. TF02-7]UMG92538.1 DUF2231 domain-containing protein [Nocardioides sp. TF02-7]
MTATYPGDSTAGAERRNPLIRWTLALERNEALDPAVRALEPVAAAVAGPPPVRDLLQGRWLGHALHPLLVMVPLGAWTSASVLDLLGDDAGREAACTLTGLGVLTAVPSAVTGLAEWVDATPRDRRTGAVHAAANAAALAVYTCSWAARRRGHHRRGALLAGAASALVGVGGYLGGHLAQVRKVGSHHPAFVVG